MANSAKTVVLMPWAHDDRGIKDKLATALRPLAEQYGHSGVAVALEYPATKHATRLLRELDSRSWINIWRLSAIVRPEFRKPVRDMFHLLRDLGKQGIRTYPIDKNFDPKVIDDKIKKMRRDDKSAPPITTLDAAMAKFSELHGVSSSTIQTRNREMEWNIERIFFESDLYVNGPHIRCVFVMTGILHADYLSMALQRKGYNVRFAADPTQFDILIKGLYAAESENPSEEQKLDLARFVLAYMIVQNRRKASKLAPKVPLSEFILSTDLKAAEGITTMDQAREMFVKLDTQTNPHRLLHR